MIEIKFQVIYRGKVSGYEKLTEKGWQWMWLELNPDEGERWTKGVIEDSKMNLIRSQYTGLKDKNGKEIYEGDIVICHPEIKYGRRLIKLDLYNGFNNGDGGDFEVIGNIYQNP